MAAALTARVVEVITDLGTADSRYRYGSGCIVRGGTVLTAAHVVAGAVTVTVRDPGKQEYTAAVDPRFVGDVDGPGPDLALLEIDDSSFHGDLPPIGLSAVDRDSATGESVERCHAVGYPWFAETRSRTRTAVRDTVDAIGVVPVLSKLKTGLLSLQVMVSPRELPPERTTLGASEWSGMSGAPVVADGYLLGVVTEHALREGPSAITAVPLTALQADPAHQEWGPGVADPAAWWSRLGVEGISNLWRLPVPPPPRPEPAYRATLREFGRALHQRMPQLLGRDCELAELAAFATGSEGYRWLMGGAFTGKTALLYEAVTVGLPDEVDVVCYFLSRRASDASSDRFLAAVVPQLAFLCGLDPPVANVDQYHALWQQAADRAVQSGRHLLLAVDGLDEDLLPSGSPSVASLLPALASAHAHVLVASRPHPALPDDVPDGHPLGVTQATVLDPFEGAQALAGLAKKEINDLTHGDDPDLAVDILGLLTAAAGPLSVMDLVALRSDGQNALPAADTLHVRRLVEERAARSLEPVGPAGHERYQFAHGSLLEYAQTTQDLRNPEYRQRIHQWAERWREAGWPTRADGDEGTPLYLLDTYPATLTQDPQQLTQLASDIGWIAAAIATAGIDPVLADLRRVVAANSASVTAVAMLAIVSGQAHHLRPPQPVDQPGYILRQLGLQAAELGEDSLADEIREQLRSQAIPGLIPIWTSRRASRALSGQLGRHDGQVNALAVLPDGRVVSGSDDRRVLMWDPASPGAAPVELGRHDHVVRAVAVLPDGRIVSGCHRVLVWNPASPGAAPVEIGRHDDWVNAVAVLPDGRVVSSGDDKRALAWDPAAPGAAPVEIGTHDDDVNAVAVLPDGRVVSSSRDAQIGRRVPDVWKEQVLVWDPASPGAAPVELGHHDHWVNAVAVLPDGRVVSGGQDYRVLVWDPASPGAAPVELGRHDDQVGAVAVLPDGRVVSGGQDYRVLVWDPASPGAAPVELGRHDDWVRAVAVLPDGRVISGGNDKRVLMWDPAALGAGPAAPRRHETRGDAVAVLPDGRVVSGGNDKRVLVWDPAARRAAPVELGHHWREVNALAVLPDGRVVSGGNDARVLVWDPASPGTAPVELGDHDEAMEAVAVLPDGRVVSGSFGWVLVWDPASPGAAPVELGRHMGWVEAVAVLPDGRVVSGGRDNQVLMWDLATPGTSRVELGRHDDWVRAVAVLPDGQVVTGGDDKRVLMWDPATPGTAPVELGRHDDWVQGVAVLPDGRVVTGGRDNQVLMWDPAVPRGGPVAQLGCSVIQLATGVAEPGGFALVIAHQGAGLSLWSVLLAGDAR